MLIVLVLVTMANKTTKDTITDCGKKKEVNDLIEQTPSWYF